MLRSILFSCLSLAAAVEAADVGSPLQATIGSNVDDVIVCHLTTTHAMLVDHDDDKDATATPHVAYSCWVDHDNSNDEASKYEIALPDDFVMEHHDIIAQHPVVHIAGGAHIEHDRIVLHDTSQLSIYAERSNHRRLSMIPFTGAQKALVVRITDAANKAPADTLDTMRGRILGVGPQAVAVNPLWQYNMCSYGQLAITPATIGQNVANGGVEVRVPVNLGGCKITTWGSGGCEDEIINAIQSTTGRNINDFGFVFIALPDGAYFQDKGANWWAFGGAGQSYMMFQRGSYNFHSFTMHEAGHRIGFGHSDWPGSLGDDTCTMGPAIQTVGGPTVCFNGQKYFDSGWAPTLVYNPASSGAKTIQLVSTVHAGASTVRDYDVAVIKVDDDLYISFNLAADFNAGTSFQNAVTVVQGSYQSTFLAALASNANLWYVNQSYNRFFTTGIFKGHIGVTLCGRLTEDGLKKARVSIYDTAKGQSSTCGSFTV